MFLLISLIETKLNESVCGGAADYFELKRQILAAAVKWIWQLYFHNQLGFFQANGLLWFIERLTVEMSLPGSGALSSSTRATLQERLGTGGGVPALQLCTASYRLSVEPSWQSDNQAFNSCSHVCLQPSSPPPHRHWFIYSRYLLKPESSDVTDRTAPTAVVSKTAPVGFSFTICKIFHVPCCSHQQFLFTDWKLAWSNSWPADWSLGFI